MAGFALAKDFIEETKERSDLNQYWYSPSTIATFVDEISIASKLSQNGVSSKTSASARDLAVLVSCPSIYFALPNELRDRCMLLDLDTQWFSDSGFLKFDFNVPCEEQLPSNLKNIFQIVVVDPPFITSEVWEKYASATKWLGLSNGGRIICTTIHENATMMKQLLNLKEQRFRPSIPNLVYQYSSYCNYFSHNLSQLNSEIDDVDWALFVKDGSNGGDGGRGSKYSDETPVQLNGDSRIPKSMSTGVNHSNWRDMPEVRETKEEVVIMDEIKMLMSLRQQLGDLKSSANNVGKILQGMIRKQSKTAQKCLSKSLETLSTNINDCISEWDKRKDDVSKVAQILGKNVGSLQILIHVEEMQKMVDETKEMSIDKKGCITKMQYGDFALKSKRYTSSIFRKMGLYLKMIKDMKKLYA